MTQVLDFLSDGIITPMIIQWKDTTTSTTYRGTEWPSENRLTHVNIAVACYRSDRQTISIRIRARCSRIQTYLSIS